MILLIHDLDNEHIKSIVPNPPDNLKIASPENPIHHCLGCFGCWIKTPAACVIQDSYGDLGEILSKCSEVIIISKSYFGSFSPFVKNVLDRSISYLHPYFSIRNGEMHHKQRYKNRFKLKIWLYGQDITEQERKTAHKLVQANSVNLYCNGWTLSFVQTIPELRGQVL